MRLSPRRLLYSPFLAQLVVIRRCNLACKYCNEFDDHSPPVPRETLERRIDRIHELGSFAIEFTGGEPLEHPDLVDLVRYASAKRFRKVMLISNGYLWNEEMVHRLNDAGLDELQVSVDGVQPNDVTIKVLKPLRKKLETITKHARFEVVISGVVGSAPAGEVSEVIAFAREHGCRPRVLLIHGHDGQLSLTPEQRAEYEHVRGLLGRKFRESGDYRTRLIETGAAPFKCRSGSRYIYVDEFGVVRWCSQTRDVFGIPLEDYTAKDLRTQFHTRKSCNEGCTVGCARTCSAPDEWRSQKLEPAPGDKPEPLVQIHSRPS